MSKDKEPVIAEVVEKGVDGVKVYQPSIKKTENIADKTGNVYPLVNAMKVAGADEPEIIKKVTEVTVSGALRNAMAMPNVEMSCGQRVVNNAEALGRVLLEKAMTGDLGAIREVLNRTEGKVPNVTHTASANVTVKGDANSIAALMNKIDNNKIENKG